MHEKISQQAVLILFLTAVVLTARAPGHTGWLNFLVCSFCVIYTTVTAVPALTPQRN